MPQHKSAEKRVRQSAKRSELNKSQLSKVKTVIKKVRAAKTKEEGVAVLKAAGKYLSQMGAKGIIHKNTASNQKSKLTKFINTLK